MLNSLCDDHLEAIPSFYECHPKGEATEQDEIAVCRPAEVYGLVILAFGLVHFMGQLRQLRSTD